MTELFRENPDTPQGTHARWFSWATGAAGGALFFLLFLPILRGNIYQGSDLGAQQFPYRAFYSYCLENGYAFLWWPQQFCGYYLHAEGQGAFFHPVQWALYRFLPLPLAFSIEFVAPFLLLYGGMVALLRHWRLPWFAALFGANLFTFSGFILYHFTHIQAITVTGHLPWILLAVDVMVRTERASAFRRAWLAMVILVASQLLSGYPQYVLFTLMALGLYVLFRWPTSGAWTRLPLLALGLLLGLLIASIQVFPTFDLMNYAQRQGESAFWKEGSLHPLNLFQWVGPWWFQNGISHGTPPWEYALYAGAAPLVLALHYIATSWKTRRPQTGYAVALAGIMLVLALGAYGGVYQFIATLPLLGAFRCPARHILLVHLAIAILGAFALARLPVQNRARTNTTLLVTLALAAWLCLPVVLWLGPRFNDAFTEHEGRLILGPLLVSIAALLVWVAGRGSRFAIFAVVALATVESALYTIPFVWHHKPQSTGFDDLHRVLARELPDGGHFEPYTGEFRAHGNWRTARLTQLGLNTYMGYVGLPPRWTLDPNAPVTKRLAGVRWEKIPFSNPTWTVHDDALPLARLVSKAVVSTAPREAIGSIDVAKTAIVNKPVQLDGGSPGTLTWERNEPGKATWTTNAPGKQLLVFAQRYHPGWTVHVDTKRAPLLRAYGDFMGSVVPAGKHTVSFKFQPASFHYGVWRTATGIALAALLWLVLGRPWLRACIEPARPSTMGG